MPVVTRHCDDCDTSDMEMFVLLDSVWLSIADKKDLLCLRCTEKRLGRKVTLYDLKPCSLSTMVMLGAYIGNNTETLPPDEFLLDASSFIKGHKEFDFYLEETGGNSNLP